MDKSEYVRQGITIKATIAVTDTLDTAVLDIELTREGPRTTPEEIGQLIAEAMMAKLVKEGTE
jgi:hypothetical protein